MTQSNDLKDRLRRFDYADHDRGCQGRCYECTCGYDDRVRDRIFEAADRIEALEAENERLRDTLEPFAKAAEAYPRRNIVVVICQSKEWPNFYLTTDDLHNARQALKGNP